jgi:hypothetical protein
MSLTLLPQKASACFLASADVSASPYTCTVGDVAISLTGSNLTLSNSNVVVFSSNCPAALVALPTNIKIIKDPSSVIVRFGNSNLLKAPANRFSPTFSNGSISFLGSAYTNPSYQPTVSFDNPATFTRDISAPNITALTTATTANTTNAASLSNAVYQTISPQSTWSSNALFPKSGGNISGSVSISGTSTATTQKTVKNNKVQVSQTFGSDVFNSQRWFKLAVVDMSQGNTRSWALQVRGVLTLAFDGASDFTCLLRGDQSNIASASLTYSGSDILGRLDVVFVNTGAQVFHVYAKHNYARISLFLETAATLYSGAGVTLLEDVSFSLGYSATSSEILAADTSVSAVSSVTNVSSIAAISYNTDARLQALSNVVQQTIVPQANFSSNVAVWGSNAVTTTTANLTNLSNVIVPQATFGSNVAVWSSNSLITNSNILHPRVTFSSNTSVWSSNNLFNRNTGGTVSGTITATGGRISTVTNNDSRYHLYNNGASAEWTFGQKNVSSHDFVLSKVVSGTETDYVTVDTSGNMEVSGDVTGKIVGATSYLTAPGGANGGGLFTALPSPVDGINMIPGDTSIGKGGITVINGSIADIPSGQTNSTLWVKGGVTASEFWRVGTFALGAMTMFFPFSVTVGTSGSQTKTQTGIQFLEGFVNRTMPTNNYNAIITYKQDGVSDVFVGKISDRTTTSLTLHTTRVNGSSWSQSVEAHIILFAK